MDYFYQKFKYVYLINDYLLIFLDEFQIMYIDIIRLVFKRKIKFM